MSFRFHPATHAYTLGGQQLPSVTTVLRAMGAVSFEAVPRHRLVAAQRRGSAVHLAVQFYNEGTLDALTLDDELRPYVDAWARFCAADGADFTPELVEVPLHNATLRFAGTPDACGPLRTRATVVDVKCGAPCAGYALQTAAYANLLLCEGIRIDRRVLVRLQSDGTYRVHEHTDRHDFDEFRALLFTYQRRVARGEL